MFLRAVIIAAAVAIYSSAIRFLEVEDSSPISKLYGGHFIFLTVWGLALSFVQSVVAAFAVFSGLRTVYALSNYLLMLSAPVELLITMLYWTINLVNPTLVLDPAVIQLPLAVDLQIHLWPAILQLLQAIWVPYSLWYAGKVGPFIAFGSLTIVFWLWTSYTYSINGVYPYPLLEILSEPARMALFAVCCLILVLFFKLIQKLQHKIH